MQYNPEFSDCLHSNTVMSILRQWIATFLKGHSNMKVDWEGTRLIEQVSGVVWLGGFYRTGECCTKESRVL